MRRDYPDRPIVGVGAVIVQDGRAVVVLRGGEPRKGEWSVPGGVLELGETLRAGVAREVREETGLEVEVGDVLDVFDSIVPDEGGRTRYHFVLIDFVCRVTGGELRAGADALEARWIRESDLDSLPLTGSAAAMIRKALLATVGW